MCISCAKMNPPIATLLLYLNVDVKHYAMKLMKPKTSWKKE